MNWAPNTTHKTRQQRAQMLHDIRAFFIQKDVLEVETPALSLAGNTDPFIESIQSSSNNTSRYLHTSPEYPMKRLLAADADDIYQICKVWRDGEIGKNHNPEFTLLEWYRVDYSYQQLMLEVSELIHLLLPDLKNKDQFISYEALFLEKFDINPHIAKQDELIYCANENIDGLSCDDLDRQAILDALLTHCIEPSFSKSCLTFVYDYPSSQSALAQIRESKFITDPKSIKTEGGVVRKNAESIYLAERFEVYFGPMELGNGYQEEVSYDRNKEILQTENAARLKAGLMQVTEDKNFLQACKSGIPQSAGVAVGLDRILMCISGVDSIQKVINFPWDVA